MAGLAHGPFVWPWPPLGTNWARPWARARLFGPLSGPIDRPEARAGPWAQAQIGWAWPRAQQFSNLGPLGPGPWVHGPWPLFLEVGPWALQGWALYLALAPLFGPLFGPWALGGFIWGFPWALLALAYWALFLFNFLLAVAFSI